MKSGNLNFLEPSGPLQACNGTDFPFTTITGTCKGAAQGRKENTASNKPKTQTQRKKIITSYQVTSSVNNVVTVKVKSG